MEFEEKQKIAKALKEKIESKGLSQVKVANAIHLVHPTTINHIVTGRWESQDYLVSDEKWRRVAGWCTTRTDWIVVESLTNVKRITAVCNEAQGGSLSKCIIGPPGNCKSESLKRYYNSHNSAYYIECDNYYTKKVFLNKIRQVMGMPIFNIPIAKNIEGIINELLVMETPLIIIDEADKLTDPVLNLFLSLYNKTHRNCGFVLAGAPFLQNRIEKGVADQRQSYMEIHSRIGSEFIRTKRISKKEIANIIAANGITDPDQATYIINLATSNSDKAPDIRQVENEVNKAKRTAEKAA